MSVCVSARREQAPSNPTIQRPELTGGATARCVEDETRNGHRNANRNPNRNHETTVVGLFSVENLKRAIKR